MASSFTKALISTWALTALASCLPSLAQASPPARHAKVQWDTLAKASSSTRNGATTVAYPAPLVQLDGKWITITGFMVPLEAKFLQSRYLLTWKLQDCEACIEGGPAAYVEVRGTPVHFRPEPLTLSGRLTLLQNDPAGMYYRLTEARPAK